MPIIEELNDILRPRGIEIQVHPDDPTIFIVMMTKGGPEAWIDSSDLGYLKQLVDALLDQYLDRFLTKPSKG